MRMPILFACILALTLGVAGCSSKDSDVSSLPDADVALTAHNPVSLYNYKQARTYAAQGRYELAREHYLLAYASAEGDPTLRGMLQREIKGVDMMIRTLR